MYLEMLISYQHVSLTLTFGLPEVRDKVLVDTLYVSLSSIGKSHIMILCESTAHFYALKHTIRHAHIHIHTPLLSHTYMHTETQSWLEGVKCSFILAMIEFQAPT